MNINDYYILENEKPLDRLVSVGGFCGIFRTICCIGDSLSSGDLRLWTRMESIIIMISMNILGDST